jgi:uncharacterized membrane protein YbhN (UPF0104 family)
VEGWRAKSWLQPAIVLSGLVLAIAVGAWLIGGVRRFVRRRRNPSAVSAAASPRWILWTRLASLASLAFLVLVASILVMFSSENFWVLSSPATPFLRLVQLFGLLSVVGAIAAVFAAVQSWRVPGERRWLSVGRSATALACLVVAYVAVAFHFLAIHLNY